MEEIVSTSMWCVTTIHKLESAQMCGQRYIFIIEQREKGFNDN